MSENHRENGISYVEFPSPSREALGTTKKFFDSVFGWKYQEWGDEYADTSASAVPSGINADPSHRPAAPLVVIYVSDLPAARDRVAKAGGRISKDIFSFPGGRRFQFVDPSGNELAVWSEK